MHMPHLDTSRRVKRVSIDPKLLAAILTKPKDGISTEIVEGIPSTAGVVGGGYDFQCNCFVLFVADASFEEVPEGNIPPELPITVRAIRGTQSSD